MTIKDLHNLLPNTVTLLITFNGWTTEINREANDPVFMGVSDYIIEKINPINASEIEAVIKSIPAQKERS